jgi:flagellar biosynthesis GTPase FlhF
MNISDLTLSILICSIINTELKKGLTFVLYGPSGVGKTFTAGKLDMSIVRSNLAHAGF